MIPKVETCIEALERGVEGVVILNGKTPHAVLLGAVHRARRRHADHYYRRYGTTLRGLMEEHGIQPDDFLEYVHDIDHSPVEADPRLGDAIERLPGRKFILTNGSRRACREGCRAPRHHPPLRGNLRHRLVGVAAEAQSGDLRPLPPRHRRGAEEGGDVRGSCPQPRRTPRARHDDRADRAVRRPRGADRGLGDGRPRRPHVDFVTDDLAAFLEGIIVAVGAR
jgi:hypothetical protein